MKQRVMHGATIEACTPREVALIVAEAFDRQRNEMYRRVKGIINLDGNGAGTAIEKTPRLYDWVLERVTVSAGPGAAVELFTNQASVSDLLESITLNAQGVYSDAFSNRIFVEAGSQLFVVVAGGAINGQATYNLQTKLIRSTGGTV